MTVHEYLKYWFENKRDSEDDVDEIIDGFFGYLAGCGLDIIIVDGDKAVEVLGHKE